MGKLENSLITEKAVIFPGTLPSGLSVLLTDLHHLIKYDSNLLSFFPAKNFSQVVVVICFRNKKKNFFSNLKFTDFVISE